ncbi:hypothetical protein G9A89_012629 [Geosiphon pyriformis]|nr:hypothetical protein G9A89_012629 [Geosiphon pyriformis]
MSEVKIWANLLKWAIAQTPSVASKPTSDFLDSDLLALKPKLTKCAPLIRFFEMSPRDVYYKVRPFEKAMPKEVFESILKGYFLTNCQPDARINVIPRFISNYSKILDEKNLKMIKKWIHNTENRPIHYKFDLLLQGTRDGFDVETFNRLCSNQGPTLILLNLKLSNQWIGGYTSISWDLKTTGCFHVTSSGNFLFSLNKK